MNKNIAKPKNKHCNRADYKHSYSIHVLKQIHSGNNSNLIYYGLGGLFFLLFISSRNKN